MENMATDPTRIFFNMISEYAEPILEAAGYRVSDGGFIEDYEGNKLFYQNPKWIDGTNDPQNPPFIYPIVPINERGYLNVKATPEYELFNPFQNFRHACIVLLKLKKVLIPFFISQEALENTDEDEIDAKFDDCFQIYNKRDNTGQFEVGIVCTEDPSNPVEIMKYSSEELTKSVWSLCVMIFTNFCSTKPMKQFKNIDRAWNKTQKLCLEWNKSRAGILQNVKVEQQKDYSDDEDLTQGIDISDNDNNDIELIRSMSTRYVDTIDSENINDVGLQAYLTSMLSDQMIPYEEEHVSADESASFEVSSETVVPNNEVPNFENMDKIETETEKSVLKEKMEADKIVQSESRRSIMSYDPRQKVTMATPYGIMGNPMGMGMNPMMGMGMNPMMMGMDMNPMIGMGMGMNLPNSNIDEINLCGVINPFAAYNK